MIDLQRQVTYMPQYKKYIVMYKTPILIYLQWHVTYMPQYKKYMVIYKMPILIYLFLCELFNYKKYICI